MKKTLAMSVAFFTFFLVHSALAQLPATTPQGKWQPTTIRRIKEPLSRTVDQIAKESGIKLTVAPDLKDLKAIVIVRDRPSDEVLNNLAEVFGCEWVAIKEIEKSLPSYRLQRKSEVEEWRSRCLRQHILAERYSYQKQGERAKKIFLALQSVGRGERLSNDGSSAADPDGINPDSVQKYNGYRKPIAQFFATLTPAQVDQIAEYYAARARDPRDMSIPAPVVIPGEDLTPTQRRLIKATGNSSFSEDGDNPLLVPGLSIAVTSQHQDQIDLMDVTRPRNPGDPTDPGFGFAGYNTRGSYYITIPTYTETELRRIAKEEYMRRISAAPIPSSALLGAGWGKEKAIRTKITPGVEISDDKATVQKQLLTVPVPVGWVRTEVLQSIAEKTGRNIIADYFTEGLTELDRMERDTQSIERTAPDGMQLPAQLREWVAKVDDPKNDLLTRLARRTSSIVRVPPNYLLCRKADWLLRERTEIPYPLVENLLVEERQFGEVFLDSLAALSRQTPAQVEALSTYSDGTTDLKGVVEVLRYNTNLRENNPIPAVLSNLPPDVIERGLQPDGASFSELPLEARRVLRTGRFTDAFGDNSSLKVRITPTKLVVPAGAGDKPTPIMRLHFVLGLKGEDGKVLPDGRGSTILDANQRPKDYVPAYQ